MCFGWTLVVGCFRHLAICSDRMVVPMCTAIGGLLFIKLNTGLFLFWPCGFNIQFNSLCVFGHVVSIYN